MNFCKSEDSRKSAILFKQGDFEGVKSLLLPWLDNIDQLEPICQAQLYWKIGSAFRAQEKYQEALSYLEKGNSAYPNLKHLVKTLGACYYYIKDSEKAFETALQLYYFDQKNYKLVISASKDMTNDFILGCVQKDQRLTNQQKAQVLKSLAFSRNKANKPDSAAQLCLKAHTYDEKESDLIRNIKALSNYIPLFYGFEKSIELAKKLNFEEREIIYLANGFSKHKNNGHFAKKIIEEFSENLENADLEILKIEGYHSKLNRDWNEAIRHYTAAQEISPKDPHIAVNLSICYNKSGRIQDAIEVLKPAWQHDRNNPVIKKAENYYYDVYGIDLNHL